MGPARGVFLYNLLPSFPPSVLSSFPGHVDENTPLSHQFPWIYPRPIMHVHFFQTRSRPHLSSPVFLLKHTTNLVESGASLFPSLIGVVTSVSFLWIDISHKTTGTLEYPKHPEDCHHIIIRIIVITCPVFTIASREIWSRTDRRWN